jgi:hypothetical protein
MFMLKLFLGETQDERWRCRRRSCCCYCSSVQAQFVSSVSVPMTFTRDCRDDDPRVAIPSSADSIKGGRGRAIHHRLREFLTKLVGYQALNRNYLRAAG